MKWSSLHPGHLHMLLHESRELLCQTDLDSSTRTHPILQLLQCCMPRLAPRELLTLQRSDWFQSNQKRCNESMLLSLLGCSLGKQSSHLPTLSQKPVCICMILQAINPTIPNSITELLLLPVQNMLKAIRFLLIIKSIAQNPLLNSSKVGPYHFPFRINTHCSVDEFLI
nr:hypothetical protein Iba_chr05aCG0150 [Ipomoea batatas]GME03807.1 hypothetical protein Iba_scaffold1380CG0040 [Ipomoea batatas]